jgi:hypothetical protein
VRLALARLRLLRYEYCPFRSSSEKRMRAYICARGHNGGRGCRQDGRTPVPSMNSYILVEQQSTSWPEFCPHKELYEEDHRQLNMVTHPQMKTMRSMAMNAWEPKPKGGCEARPDPGCGRAEVHYPPSFVAVIQHSYGHLHCMRSGPTIQPHKSTNVFPIKIPLPACSRGDRNNGR